MIHILHLIESLEFGGAEKVVVHLANQLSKNHKISICLTKYEGELTQQLNQNITVYSFLHGEGNNPKTPKKIADIISKHKIDIVHAHNWSTYLDAFAAQLFSSRAKIIHTVHGPYTDYGDGFTPNLKKQLRHCLERFASLRNSTYKIVTVSDSIQKYITKDIGISSKKLITIRNGIKPIVSDDCAKSDNKMTKLVTVGRLALVKNHQLLLKATKLALSTNPNIHLTLIGDGPERSNLERLCKSLELTENVEFLGFKTNVEKLLPKYDIFILSSNYEGISIALLEAMSSGMSAIATNVGGVTETITNNETGLVVPPQNINALAEAITKLTSSTQLRNKLGLKAKHYFNNNFHEGIVIKKYASLYQQCYEER